MADFVEILARLVGVKGLTGGEREIVLAAADCGRALKLDQEIGAEGIVLRVNGRSGGPTVLFCSHLDTVPEGDGWSVPPHKATIANGALYGRGSADARASCACILATVARLTETGLARGCFIGVLSVGEEGDDPSLPRLLDRIGPADAAIVGEPTMMRIGVRQKGLLTLTLSARGEQAHAARHRGTNAILSLARDLTALDAAQTAARGGVLAGAKITPTRLSAGVADNVTAAVATATLDVRTDTMESHEGIVEAVRGLVKAEVSVAASLWPPCETPETHPMTTAAREALGTEVFASDAASDWVFLAKRGIPTLKIGPGDMSQAHRPDEHITIKDFQDGIAGYIRLAEALLGRL